MVFNFYLLNLGGPTESRLAATTAVLGRAGFFSPRRSCRSAADETVGGETDGGVHAERRPRLVTHAAPVDHFLVLLLLLPIIHSPFYGPVGGGVQGDGGRFRMVAVGVTSSPSRQRMQGGLEIDAGCSPLPPQEERGRGGRGNLNLNASCRRRHLSKPPGNRYGRQPSPPSQFLTSPRDNLAAAAIAVILRDSFGILSSLPHSSTKGTCPCFCL